MSQGFVVHIGTHLVSQTHGIHHASLGRVNGDLLAGRQPDLLAPQIESVGGEDVNWRPGYPAGALWDLSDRHCLPQHTLANTRFQTTHGHYVDPATE